ncbi:MAG: hypothetical protein ACI4JA_10185 [Oscillospiraceae bacterium]
MNITELSKFFEEDKVLYISINRAFNDLYRYDKFLINNEPIIKEDANELGKHYVNERAIVFRFAHYLQNELVKDPKYATYNLDCEYSRSGINPKVLPDFPNGTYPDIIIHHRGKNDYGDNLLVMEFKTYWHSDTEKDSLKISEFVDKNGEYKYKYGLVVVVGRKLKETTFEVHK